MDDPLPNGLLEAWREYFAKPHHSGDVFKHPLLFPLQRQAESKRMLEVAAKLNPRVVYEVGADKGGGFNLWLERLPTVRRAAACEIRGLPYAAAFEEHYGAHDFHWIAGSSYDIELRQTFRKWLGPDRIDVLFIDGDKGSFLTDFRLNLPYMSKRGVVFFHDHRDEGPSEAVAQLRLEGYRIEECVDVSDSEDALSRPPITEHDNWLRHWGGRSCGFAYILGT